jgi:hypothetical protein
MFDIQVCEKKKSEKYVAQPQTSKETEGFIFYKLFGQAET